MCAANATAPTSCLPASLVGHGRQLVTPSVHPSVERALGKLCLFALVCLPALCPSVRCPFLSPPLSGWLPCCCSIGSMWLRWSMRRRRISVSDVVSPKAISKTAPPTPIRLTDGLTTVKRPPSLAINTPSTVGLIFAPVDRRRTRRKTNLRVGEGNVIISRSLSLFLSLCDARTLNCHSPSPLQSVPLLCHCTAALVPPHATSPLHSASSARSQAAN